jgi:hypothetical protein
MGAPDTLAIVCLTRTTPPFGSLKTFIFSHLTQIITYRGLTDTLLVEAVQLFSDAFDKLLAAVARKDQGASGAQRQQSSRG